MKCTRVDHNKWKFDKEIKEHNQFIVLLTCSYANDVERTAKQIAI